MFKVASYEWHEIKKTHRVIWDGCIWNGISLTNASWVSQSVLCEVLNAVSDDVFKTKCLFNGEIIFYSAFKKDTEKVLLKWKAWYKLLSSSGLYVSITRHPFEGHEISVTKAIVHIWKWNTNLIQLLNLVLDIWKNISQGACFFTVVHACTKSLKEAHKMFSEPLNYFDMDYW